MSVKAKRRVCGKGITDCVGQESAVEMSARELAERTACSAVDVVDLSVLLMAWSRVLVRRYCPIGKLVTHLPWYQAAATATSCRISRSGS